MKKKMRNEIGATITLFVLFTCLFIVGISVIVYSRVSNEKQAQNRQIDQITKSYSQNETQMEEAYQKAISNK